VNCTKATCGDGHVQAGVELCDDGPNNGMYGFCASGCMALGPRCGDNEKNGPEECDDGNQTDDDACSNDCIAPRLVFVTSAMFSGNLGGLAGADAKCAAVATELGKPGAQWRAWLSDDTGSPSTRMDTAFTGWYQLVDGTPVAHGWSDLTDGTLSAPINLTEHGTPSGEPLVAWSNTTPTGKAISGEHCNNWTSSSPAPKGRAGATNDTNVDWTDFTDEALNPITCSAGLHLYCFQDLP
jgi:cysteine-rich repeat protein